MDGSKVSLLKSGSREARDVKIVIIVMSKKFAALPFPEIEMREVVKAETT